MITGILTDFTIIISCHGGRQSVQIVTISHLISGSISSPKLNRVIIGTGAENVTQRMPAQAPHNTVVCRVYRTNFLLSAEVEKIIN